MNIKFIVLSGLLAYTLCFAAKPADEQEFNFNVYEQSPCLFKLQNYTLTKPVEAGIRFGVQCILEAYTDTFGLEFPDDFKVTLIIFDDKDMYNKYYKNRFGSDALADGYFSLGDNECVVWKNTDIKQMLNILFHEANHLLMAHHYPHCPMWLNEGLSQYFQGLNVIGKNKRVYPTNDCKEWNMHWLRKGFPIEPRKYVDLDYDKWNELRAKDVTAAYSIGYSMTYFLMENSLNREILKKLMLESKNKPEEREEIIIHNGEKYRYKKIIGRPSTVVINEIYKGGYAEFEKDWRKWIPSMRMYHPVRVMRGMLAEKKPAELREHPAIIFSAAE